MPVFSFACSRLFALATLSVATPLSAVAADCPWLTTEAAATAMLMKPTVSLQQFVAPANNPERIKRASSCYFKDPAESIGQLGVTLIEYDSAAVAQLVFDKEKASSGDSSSLKVAGQPALHRFTRGAHNSTWVLKGDRVLRVDHLYTNRVKAAIAKDPGAVVGTQELARQAMGKL